MTYEKKYEVLEAAATWMRVCEKAGVEAMLKWNGSVKKISVCTLNEPPHEYEFPLALLEGKEVWVGSELYDRVDGRFIVTESDKDDDVDFSANGCSWNPPKPATVMVKLDTQHAEDLLESTQVGGRLHNAIKKALESIGFSMAVK